MIATLLPTTPNAAMSAAVSAVTATSRLQIKYVSRRPPQHPHSHPATLRPSLTATVLETPNPSSTQTQPPSSKSTRSSSSSWTLTTNLTNPLPTPQTSHLTISTWPMFSPEETTQITTRTTTIPGNSAQTLSFEIPMSRLGSVDNEKAKCVLEEGIYMFGVSGRWESAQAGVGAGTTDGLIKQVCVVGRREWDL